MSLLASGWSRVYVAGIRRGTPGALVAVQNLVITGSSGPVRHAALFFYTCMQSFHILEAAWKSRCKCENGAVYKNVNFSGCSFSVCILQRLAHMPLKLKKQVCFLPNQANVLFHFSSGPFRIWKPPNSHKIKLVWNGSSSVLSWTLQNSSLHLARPKRQHTECNIDGKWLFIATQINVPPVYSVAVFVFMKIRWSELKWPLPWYPLVMTSFFFLFLVMFTLQIRNRFFCKDQWSFDIYICLKTRCTRCYAASQGLNGKSQYEILSQSWP